MLPHLEPPPVALFISGRSSPHLGFQRTLRRAFSVSSSCSSDFSFHHEVRLDLFYTDAPYFLNAYSFVVSLIFISLAMRTSMDTVFSFVSSQRDLWLPPATRRLQPAPRRCPGPPYRAQRSARCLVCVCVPDHGQQVNDAVVPGLGHQPVQPHAAVLRVTISPWCAALPNQPAEPPALSPCACSSRLCSW